MSTNKKTKDTIILKSIIKMNDTMEREYIYYKEANCTYHEENNNMI